MTDLFKLQQRIRRHEEYVKFIKWEASVLEHLVYYEMKYTGNNKTCATIDCVNKYAQTLREYYNTYIKNY